MSQKYHWYSIVFTSAIAVLICINGGCKESSKANRPPTSAPAPKSAKLADKTPPIDATPPMRIISIPGGYTLKQFERSVRVTQKSGIVKTIHAPNPIQNIHVHPNRPIFTIVAGSYHSEYGTFWFEDGTAQFVFLEKNIVATLSDVYTSYLNENIWSPDGKYAAISWGNMTLEIVNTDAIPNLLAGTGEADFVPDVDLNAGRKEPNSYTLAHTTDFLNWLSPTQVRFYFALCGSWRAATFDLTLNKKATEFTCISGDCLWMETRRGYVAVNRFTAGDSPLKQSKTANPTARAAVNDLIPLWNHCIKKHQLNKWVINSKTKPSLNEIECSITQKGQGHPPVVSHALKWTCPKDACSAEVEQRQTQFEQCMQEKSEQWRAAQTNTQLPPVLKIDVHIEKEWVAPKKRPTVAKSRKSC